MCLGNGSLGFIGVASFSVKFSAEGHGYWQETLRGESSGYVF